MNPQVERLEALLARVQHNRKLPRVQAVAVAAPELAPNVEPTEAKAPPLTPPTAAERAVVAAAEPAPIVSLDTAVEDAEIVAEVKAPAREAAAPASRGPVLELGPRIEKPTLRVDDDYLVPEAVSPVAEAKSPVLEGPLPAAAVPEPVVAVPEPVAAVPEPVVEARAPVVEVPLPVVAAPEPAAPATPAEAGPVPIVLLAHATPSGPIAAIVAPLASGSTLSFGALVARTLALRPR